MTGRLRRALERLTPAWGLNLALRLSVLGFAVEAARSPGDPRFVGKGIPVRNVILAGSGLVLPLPLLHRYLRHGEPYPVQADSLFLSILVLDMAGNSLDLYERGWRFDLIPHSYGPFAGVATLRAMGWDPLSSAVAVNAAHLLLEIQEALGDAVFGTHNVHGWWDTVGDLGAGLVGSLAGALAVGRPRGGAALGRAAPRRRAAYRSYSAA